MTSMVAPINIGLQFRGNWFNAKKKIVDKAGEFLKPSFNSSLNTNVLNNNKRRFLLLVTASSHCSPGGMDTINEMEHTALDHRFVEDGLEHRQIFFVRSYETEPDKTITMETLMNFLQETALNHACSCWVSKNDFGATHEMDLRKLIWIVTRIQIQVQRYSKRTWAMMNGETRRLSKIPEEVRQELVPFCFNRSAFATEEIDHQKIHKLTDVIAGSFRYGMAAIQPGWNDMDANHHVNNVKYVRWILESVPREALEDYKMTSMTLEFRRECTQSDLLESMTSPSSSVI